MARLHGHVVELDPSMIDEVSIGRLEKSDACAALLELRRRALVHLDTVAGVGEQAGGGEPAERSPDDGDVHALGQG